MKTKIIYEDKDILVCHKPAGLATQSAQTWQQDLVSECKNYLAAAGNKNPFLGIVHRLDQPVEGLLVLAKNQKAAAKLSAGLKDQSLNKSYYALVLGGPDQDSGELTDYLIKDGNVGKVVFKDTPQAKTAHLQYHVLKRTKAGTEEISLLEVSITTGRFHQIRLQLSHAGWPILSDNKYGGEKAMATGRSLKISTVALCAHAIDLSHPVTGGKMHFEVKPVWYDSIEKDAY